MDPADKQTIVVKTKPLRYEQTVTAGGKKTVTWYVPDMQVTSDGGGVPVVAFTGGPNATDYSKSDFAGFEWISPRNFEGTQKVAGQDCLVFRDALKIDGRIVKSEHPLMSVACIAADSRLPVALQLGDEVRTYQFGSAPTAMLTLPPDVEAVVAQWRQTIRRASLPAAKP